MSNKTRNVFECSECGYTNSAWTGRCPNCQGWGTLLKKESSVRSGNTSDQAIPVSLMKVESPGRSSSGILELDRVLGGGFVNGGVVLLGGEPGVGKSTLLLQVCGHMASSGIKTLYLSGEESPSQIALRARRLGLVHKDLHLSCGNVIESLLSNVLDYGLIVLDSVQAVKSEAENSWPGSPTQVRAVSQLCVETAKANSIPMVLIGHITKEGRIAGPMLLEHMVDTVLGFSGDKTSSYRMVRAVKNRFGNTDELGIFEMSGGGLVPVQDPSRLYWNKTDSSVSGVAMSVLLEGSVPLIVEIQSLSCKTSFPYPKRASYGIDLSKIYLLTAVLDKRCGISSFNQDVYCNVTGGMVIREPGADLAIVASLASSVMDMVLPSDCCFIGEVGLAGEIRPVSRLMPRVKEAERLGFKKVFISSLEQIVEINDIEIIRVRNLHDFLEVLRK